ncbi:Reverse transcriptase zinc-binding domain [Macleaya cordata]|uniref:Reverse transcriptase zinc-binding domain n=1 Tax=Macleaya cordata TaxID=56857 RepID=A0A200QIL5_MACCD|nr:Reverse transcriptase zinc-binding domain [Macleaya cordata]
MGSIQQFTTELHSGQRDWNIRFSREIYNSEMPQLAELLQAIGPAPPLLNNEADTFSWSLTPKGNFTVQSLYEHLSSNQNLDFPSAIVWNSKLPPKICFFMRQASLGKILTLDNLINCQMHTSYVYSARNHPTTSYYIAHSPNLYGIKFFHSLVGVGASPKLCSTWYVVGPQMASPNQGS